MFPQLSFENSPKGKILDVTQCKCMGDIYLETHTGRMGASVSEAFLVSGHLHTASAGSGSEEQHKKSANLHKLSPNFFLDLPHHKNQV